MLKIGDFSKVAQVSIKALRYYDKQGLLQPAWIDRFTGYRYYTLEQLPRLNRILALKDFGFSLAQIRQMLIAELSLAELQGMMRLKRGELERHIEAEQARLARIEARLRQIDQEHVLPQYEVVVKPVPAQQVVGIRDRLDSHRQMAALFDELAGFLQSQQIAPDVTRPYIGIYHDGGYQERDVDLELAVPADQKPVVPSRMVWHRLPAIERMACVIYQGGYEQLPLAYKALVSWIDAAGYQVDGPNRDVYLQRAVPEQNRPAVTEVQFPIRKKPFLSAIPYKEKSFMNPEIVTCAPFTVVGLRYHGKNENQELSQLWAQFMPRSGEVRHLDAARRFYGVCGPVEEDGRFQYVAGVEVTEAADIPEGMVSQEVPRQSYAVFPCTLKTVGETYQYAFDTWLPQSNYRHVGGLDFELYDDDFDPETGTGMAVYIPVEVKK